MQSSGNSGNKSPNVRSGIEALSSSSSGGNTYIGNRNSYLNWNRSGRSSASPVIDQGIAGVGTDERPILNERNWTNNAFE
jgi:hypothetical protein